MFKNLANENVYYKNAVYRLTKFYVPSVLNEITKDGKKYDFHFYVKYALLFAFCILIIIQVQQVTAFYIKKN